MDSPSTTFGRREPASVALLGRAVDVGTRIGLALAGAAVLAALGLIAYAVLMRYAFNSAPTWVDDSVGFLLVAVVMLAAPRTMREGGHIAVDIVVGRLSRQGRRWIDVLSTLAMAAVALILLINGSNTVESSRMLGLTSGGNIEAPTWILQLFLPIGGALMLLVCIEQLARQALGLQSLARPSHGAHGPVTEEQP